MSSEFNKIKKFFRENDYYVRVSSSHDKTSCIAEFPERTAIKPWIDGKTCLYSIDQKGILYFRSGFPSIKTELDLVEEKSLHIECPPYAKRIVIFNDIFSNTEKIGLSIPFILFCDHDGIELSNTCNFTDLLNPPQDEKGAKLELDLAEIFYMTLEDPNEDYSHVAKEYGVEQGYQLLKDPFV